jgi:tricorn protease
MIATPPSIPSRARAALRASGPIAWLVLAGLTTACAATSAQMPAPETGDAAGAADARTTATVPPAVPLSPAVVPDGQPVTKLLRYPDIHQDLVVFSYAGDLWLVKATGGTAARLTAHPGLEIFPKFSPDGQWIAFTAQYNGDEQVYVVSVGGGTPRQLTFYPARGPLPARWGYDNQVYGWTPDAKQVLFRSLRDSFDLGTTRLYTVPVTGGVPTPLPMPQAGAGDLSPDGKRVAYSPLFRDFRTWKRYAGGWAQDLYVFELDGTKARRITQDPRADRDPMWIGQNVYFNSDRSGFSNLYRHDLASDQVEQITRYTAWDVRWPSADADGQIVFELDGDLHVLDTRTGQDRALAIYVPDDGISRQPERVSAASHIEWFSLSPDGARALFVGRGDVFTAPVEHGLVRNLTHSPNAHDRDADWSADGTQIVYVSDWTGEEELWIVDHRGQEPARQLTRDTRARLSAPRFSPDGKHIAYSDQRGKIHVIPSAGGRAVEVGDEPFGDATDYVWSPDGQYLAFSLNDASGLSSVYVWSVREARARRITDPLFHAHTPAWHPAGEHLYYLSTREFQPQIGQFEWNYAINRATVILGVALHKDAANPFGPRNDEVGAKKAEEAKAGKPGAGKPGAGKAGAGADKAGAAKPGAVKPGAATAGKPAGKGQTPSPGTKLPRVRIDFDGLSERVFLVPLPADNYAGLVATDTHLVYGKRDAFFYGREPTTPPVLQAFSIEERKPADVVTGVQGWSVAHDGQSVLVQEGEAYKVYGLAGAGAGAGNGKPGEAKQIGVDKLVVQRVPAMEWQVVFNEVWRRFRDYFYVDNMHGYDWNALRAKYQPLLAHVSHRADLNYLIGEMIAELNASHAYIAGGDEKLPPRPGVALLGARFELDRAAGRYRIARIFRGHNAEKRYRSPLTEVGVNVAEGDYLLAINGQDLGPGTNPYQLLQAPAGQPVELLVNRRPARAGARTVIVEPLTSEIDLIYLAWVAENRQRVERATKGRVGYLHLPDMGANGIREFIKWYYGQVRKEGLIIDVRGNGGGNVSQMLIERLSRKLRGVDFARNFDVPATYPSVVFHGHMVTLINETSASDGDIFPWMFREAGLGPLIGKRTWGGIIGITDHGPLIDGGNVFVPEFGNASADGQWVIEGVGVTPDIEVENDPISVLQGRDPQLERAIEEVLKRMQEKPMRLPERPAPPVKTPEAMTKS